MSEKKSKNIVIIALCITLIFMGVGFAVLSQNLTINGTATVTGTWDVEIAEDSENSKAAIEAVKAVYAGVEVSSENLSKFNNASGTTLNATNEIYGAVGFDAAQATFDVLLNEPGDYVIYKVRVANKGTIAAKLKAATLSDDSKTDVEAGATLASGQEATKIFKFEVVDSEYAATTDSDLVASATTLAASGEEYYYVKVTYQDTALESIPGEGFKTATGTLVLNYEQD